MSNTYVIMNALASSETPLNASRQQLIFDWAAREEVDATLCALCERADLTDELDAQLGEITRYKVRASWLARPGRTQEEVEAALRTERRQRVLAALASNPGLTDDVYDMVLARSNGAVSLTEFACGDAPLRYRIAALEKLSRTELTLTFTQESKLRTALEADSELRAVVLRRGIHQFLFATAFSYAMPDEFDADIRERVFEQLVWAHMGRVDADVRAASDAKNKGESVHTDRLVILTSAGYWLRNLGRHLDGVCAEIGASDAERAQVRAALQVYLDARWHEPARYNEFVTLADDLVKNNGITDAATSRLREALVSDDATVAANAATVLAGYFSDNSKVGFATRLFSEALQRGVSETALDIMLDAHYTLWKLALKQSDITDEHRVRTLASHAEGHMNISALLEAGADPTVVISAWAQSADPRIDTLAPVVLRWSDPGNPDAVRALPASLLAGDIYSGATPAVAEALTVFGGQFMDRYGVDPGAWRMLSELGDGGQLTIGDVYDLIDASGPNEG